MTTSNCLRSRLTTVGICLGAQAIELGHDLHERLLHVSNRVLRVELALLVETALALDEFFAVEIL